MAASLPRAATVAASPYVEPEPPTSASFQNESEFRLAKPLEGAAAVDVVVTCIVRLIISPGPVN